MDSAHIEENATLEQAVRRAHLLAAAAAVSQNLTQILDIEELLPKTVDIICEAYNFYYAGVFLVDEAGEFAVLQAGRGEPGRIMMENNHKLAVGGNSMIGACTARNEARISLDVDTEKVWYPNPVLPETRSEMALPLAIGNYVIGAVTVQSTAAAAFSAEDISSLQAMANQLAIAIDNARKQRELEETHAQLLRAKTFEAIATATGDAIHWIGNKAEPIGASIERVRHDAQLIVSGMAEILKQAQAADKTVESNVLAKLLRQEAEIVQQNRPELGQQVKELMNLASEKLEQQLSLASILEDLDIIEEAASLIMKVKEDLIGPAREQAPRPTMIDDVLKDAVSSLNIDRETVTTIIEESLPLVLADPVQLNRVFVNLLQNAREAMLNHPDPQITLTLQPDVNGEFVKIDITDNGVGIAGADLSNIWITFHTTKGVKGHTGLGLPACRLILEQLGGDISVTSRVDEGTTFTVRLPAYQSKASETKAEPGRGKLLLIDDDDHWRRFAAATLESNGYKVTAFGPNDSANQYTSYDLILIDDILAQGDSLTLMQAIKSAGAIAKTVAVSSNPRVERTKERKLLGIHDLLPKPYTPASLLRDVKSVLTTIRSSHT
jgi:signal transduction histidine kinase